ncbi:MAG: hypothetical protein KF681_07045 [Bdellovibrionaceae bacterium]|nr:hypothetical protein [Pseudobdellovibrionaceae bacterium]
MSNFRGLFILMIFSLSTVASQVEAKDSLFLSFQDFKSLNAQDRVSYLESMRQMAVNSERTGAPVRGASISSPSEFWAAVLMAKAEAARGDSCIYAGYLSQRDSNNSCVRPAAASGSCGAGQTQCNPLLFGYGPSSGGICTSDRSYPTRDCEKKYQALPNYKAYDVANELVKRNMQGEFDAQAAKLQQYCSGSTSGEQRNMCKMLSAKSSFMKAKIAASEQRKRDSERQPAQAQDRPQAAPAAPQVQAPAAPAPAPRSEPATPAAPPRQSDIASPAAPAPSQPAPAAAPAANPAPTAPAQAAPRAAEPRPTQASDTPPAAPAPARSADGCIRNITDYKAVESKLPEPFRKMLDQRSNGVFMSGSKSVPLIINLKMVMNLRFVEVNGVKKLKLQSAISSDAPSLASNSDSDSYVDKICLQGDAMLVHIPGAPVTTVKMNGRQVNISTSKGGMDVDLVDKPSYNMQLAGVRSAIRGGAR